MRFPLHFLGRRGGRNEESSIALIITLAVMSLLLVLVLTFATVTKVEIATATANRDLIQSKFLAQAAFERAMAELILDYQNDSNTMNDGLLGTYSEIMPTGSNISVASVTGISRDYVTDIEKVIFDPVDNRWLTTNGADGIVDYVVIPNAQTNFAQGLTPHWVAMRNTNGQLVGRIAFVAVGAGLCINTIGNTNASGAGGPVMNSRSQGLSATELNLVAAFRAMGWTYTQSTNNAAHVVRARFLTNELRAGTAGVDEDGNATIARYDKLDNDADGLIDEVNEGLDEPNEFLAASEHYTNSATVVVASVDDQVFTDLKQLYDPTAPYISSAAVRSDFLGSFGSIQRFFSTQAPVPIPQTYLNLNSTSYINAATGFYDTNAFFQAMTNKLAAISYPSADPAEQLQMACNIASYRNTNRNANMFAPVQTTYNGTNIVGVGMAPIINEITYRVVLKIEKNLNGGVTNIILSFPNDAEGNAVFVEYWYPYTTNANCVDFPPTGATTVSHLIRKGIDTVQITGQANAPVAVDDTPANEAGFSMTTPAFNAITNSTSFRLFSNNLGITAAYPQTEWSSVVNVLVSNFYFRAELREESGSPKYFYDVLPPYAALNPLTNGVSFSHAEITNRVANPPGAIPDARLTGIVSICFNDPRVKTNWSVQYMGNFTNAGTFYNLGARNHTNFYNPQISGADDALVTSPIPGIATNTFYFPQTAWFASPIELGRVHRGHPWKTIDFTATHPNSATDGNLLNYFTIYNPDTAGITNYLHGRININTAKTEFPVWAALFAGIPLWDGSYLDYAGGVLGNLTKSTNLTTIFTSAKYSTPSALMTITNLANMQTNFPSSGWPAQRTDIEREWILNKTFNLMSTRGAGNFFNVWCWGQTLKGPADNENIRTVSSETLIFGMLQPRFYTIGSTPYVDMRIVYFRYNPDLTFTADLEDTAQVGE